MVLKIVYVHVIKTTIQVLIQIMKQISGHPMEKREITLKLRRIRRLREKKEKKAREIRKERTISLWDNTILLLLMEV